MTTPNKCEHREKDRSAVTMETADNARTGRKKGDVYCWVCGQKFVPSDVLEEARKLLSSVEWGCSDEAPSWCPRCAETEPNHAAWCQLPALLRRIDEVLGE